MASWAGHGAGSGIRLRSAAAITLAFGAGLAILEPARADTAAPAPTPASAPIPAPPPAAAAAAPIVFGDPLLNARLGADGTLVIAGEAMHKRLLRRFYAAHGNKTVWADRPAVAAALTTAVLASQTQGLDPALFHGPALAAHGAALSPVERDLLLSDAFLSYADALARGAVPIEVRYTDENLAPDPVDVVAALDAAIAAPDPGRALLALAPASPDYEALQHAYAEALASPLSGSEAPMPAARRRAEPVPVQRRIRQLAIGLERLRWLPRLMPTDRIVVNTASAMLQLFRNDRQVFATRVVVGMLDWQTPEFQSEVDSVLFNPPWNVPPSILEKEIIPESAGNPNYLAQHHMRWIGPNRLQQVSGPYSALGRLKFEMPDPYDVYLHDTPERFLFARGNRRVSHGCVRVQDPQELAALLLGETPQQIGKAIALGYVHRRQLPTPMPVFIVYQDVVVEPSGAISYLPDAYSRDGEVWDHLNRAGQLPMAQDSQGGQRKG